MAYVASSLGLSLLLSLHSLCFFRFFYILYSPLLFLSLRLLSPGVSASVRLIIYSLLPSICQILCISYRLSLCCFHPGSPLSWFCLRVIIFLLGLLRLVFWTPYSLLSWSVFASLSAVVLSLHLLSPLSLFFSLNLSSGFPLPFATSSVYPSFVCQPVSFTTALLSSPFHLVCSCFAALPTLRLHRSCFSCGFSVLYRLSLRFFHPRVPMAFPCWYGHSFQLPLLCFWVSFFLLSFICFSLASAFCILCCSFS